MIRIVLPWPPKELNPNLRVHWAIKYKFSKWYKKSCWTLAKVAVSGRSINLTRLSNGKIPVTIKFFPPDRRHRDDDNMIGAFKYGRDGIANALEVNDRFFSPKYLFPCGGHRSGVIVFEVQTDG